MKLIHIENKIDPQDVEAVIRNAKLDFASTLIFAIRQSNSKGNFYGDNELIEFIGRLLKVNPDFL